MRRRLRKIARVALVLVVIFLAWFWLLPNGGHPRTMTQSVDLLSDTLSEEDLDQVSATPESDLIKYHFGLGSHIRNEHGLWSGNLRLKISTGHYGALLHPDYASGPIIRALWRKLQKRKR